MHSVLAAAAAAAFLQAQASPAPSLGPGDPAPALKVAEFVKGTPFTSFAKGKVHIVEFWATWCGPCLESIPHLSKLAQKHRGKVTVTGVSVWETASRAEVQRFVRNMGSKMDYNVALDTKKGDMSRTWMEAAGQEGIPAAFIVKDGIIQWIGHPMEMDGPLEKVLAGSLDTKEQRKAVAEKTLRTQKIDAYFREIQSFEDTYPANREHVQKRLNEIEAYPEFKEIIPGLRLILQHKEDPAGALAAAELLTRTPTDEHSNTVLVFGGRLAQSEASKADAAKVAGYLMDNGASWSPWFSAGLIYADLDDKPKARLALEKSLAALERAEMPAARKREFRLNIQEQLRRVKR